MNFTKEKAKDIRDKAIAIADYVLAVGMDLGEIHITAEVEEESYKIGISIGNHKSNHFRYEDEQKANGDVCRQFWHFGDVDVCLTRDETSYSTLERCKNENV